MKSFHVGTLIVLFLVWAVLAAGASCAAPRSGNAEPSRRSDDEPKAVEAIRWASLGGRAAVPDRYLPDACGAVLGHPSLAIPLGDVASEEYLRYRHSMNGIINMLFYAHQRGAIRVRGTTSRYLFERNTAGGSTLGHAVFLAPSLVHLEAEGRVVLVYRSFYYSKLESNAFIVLGVAWYSPLWAAHWRLPPGYVFAGKATLNKDGSLEVVLESPDGPEKKMTVPLVPRVGAQTQEWESKGALYWVEDSGKAFSEHNTE